MEESDFEYLWKRRHEILYRIELSALYHQKRERFFELCDKLAKAMAVIGGSAALANLGGASMVKVAAAIITVTSTLSLVLGFSDRARRHAEFARSFRELEGEVVALGERDFAEPDLNAWMARTRALESTEPPALSALVRLCQNELALAQGHPESVHPVAMHQRYLAHLFDFSAASSV